MLARAAPSLQYSCGSRVRWAWKYRNSYQFNGAEATICESLHQKPRRPDQSVTLEIYCYGFPRLTASQDRLEEIYPLREKLGVLVAVPESLYVRPIAGEHSEIRRQLGALDKEILWKPHETASSQNGQRIASRRQDQ